MKVSRILLALVGTVVTSLAVIGLANHELKNADFGIRASSVAQHFRIDKDTTLVPFEYSEKYKIPRGEGDDDDIVCTVISGNRLTPYTLNYEDAFLFVPDIKYDDDYFKIFVGINNLTHFRVDYYLSENRSDNACTVNVVLYEIGEGITYEFMDTSYTVSRGAGYYEWNRPEGIDPSIKAGRLFLYFKEFKGDPTFRVVTIDLDWVC